MHSYKIQLYDSLLYYNFQIIKNAYKISKKLRKIHKEYLWYSKVVKKKSSKSYFHINMYMNYILQKYKWKIDILLFCFKVIIFFIESDLFSFISIEYKKKNDFQSILCDRRILWIETTLKDLQKHKENILFFTTSKKQIQKNNWININNNRIDVLTQNIPYEFVGLIPRSITRTLSRFQTELLGNSEYIILPEFRFAKFQAVTSFQYIASLVLFPWGFSHIVKILFTSWITSLWNVYNYQIFISISQEEKALKELQNIEELLWLDMLLSPLSNFKIEEFSVQIYKNTIDIVETYNQQSIDTIINLITNCVYLATFLIVLILGKKRLSILNSWMQEVFYSLSDTMKSFFILLLTDLCIGFHSPHGWEILIQFILDNLGVTNNKHIVSCFVSTFPVILDTVFKYWIFRHLNRISPSIVVNYHAMNE